MVQAAQTVALIILACAVIYALYLLRREMRGAANTLRQVVDEYRDMNGRVRAIERELDINRPRAHDEPPRSPPPARGS
jgi:hypothetical protein